MRYLTLAAFVCCMAPASSLADEAGFLTPGKATKLYGVHWAQGYLKAYEYWRSNGAAGAAEIVADYAGIVGAGAAVRNTSTSTDIGHAIGVMRNARGMATAAASGNVRGFFDAYADAAGTIMKHGGDAVGRRVSWEYVHRSRGALGFWKAMTKCMEKDDADKNPKLLWQEPKPDPKKDPNKDPVEKDPKFYPQRSDEMLPKNTTGEVKGDVKVKWKGGKGKDGACHVHRNKDGSYQRYWVNSAGKVWAVGIPYWNSMRDMLAARAAAGGGKTHKGTGTGRGTGR